MSMPQSGFPCMVCHRLLTSVWYGADRIPIEETSVFRFLPDLTRPSVTEERGWIEHTPERCRGYLLRPPC